MYITCKQCSTIFRLEETLLKPGGSKVRCSQCRNVFVANPPVPEPAIAEESGIAAAVAGTAGIQGIQDTFDKELEGIDLAELDSILENNDAMGNGDTLVDVPEAADSDELVEFNEADLDLDFESALEEDAGDEPVPAAKPTAQASDEKPVSAGDELDLDMDFELDDSVEESVAAMADAPSGAAADELDLEMDFELDGEPEENEEQLAADDDLAMEEVELGEDVESALDEFADVLGDGEWDDIAGAPTAADDLLEEAQVAESDAAENGAVAEDAPGEIDLGDLDTLLGTDEEDAPAPEPVDEDTELTLADDDEIEMELDADAPAAQETAAVSASGEGDDDFDLAGGLDEMLDEETPELDTGETEDVELSLDEEPELDLSDDSDSTVDADMAESALPEDQAEDDLDLGGLDDLLKGDDETAEAGSIDEALSMDEDIDIDLEDIELDLDEEAALEAEPSTETAPEDEAISLDEDFDIDLSDIDLPETDEADEAEELDLELEEVTAPEAAPADAASEDGAISLDEDFDIDLSDIDLPETDEADEAEELDLELEEVPAPEAEPSAGAPAEAVSRDEFDLSDFESLLSEGDAVPAADSEDEGLELEDLDGLLEGAELSEAATDEDDGLSMADDLDLSLDDDLSLEMDTEAPAATEETAADGDDFDLSMLEPDALDDEPDEDRETPDEDTELSLDDDMELVMDDAPAPRAASDDGDGADLPEIEDLDFELDAEFEDKPIFQDSHDAEDVQEQELVLEEQEDSSDAELDLTDIEKMLEDDTIVPDVAEAEDDSDLDLGSDGAEIWAEDADGDLGLGSDEIDLSDIEDAINSADHEGTDELFADGEDDLDLDLEPEVAQSEEAPEMLELDLEMENDAPVQKADAGSEDELDLSEFNLSLEEDKNAVDTETIDGGDIQLEFQVDTADPNDLSSQAAETADAAEAAAAIAETAGFSLDDETFSEEDTITTELVKEVTEAEGGRPSSAPMKKKKKGGTSKLLIILLVLAALGGGGFYGYDYVIKNNINIPYLSDYINPEAKDPSGIIKLATSDINGKFIENTAAGRIFAVTGKVRNGYTVPRKLIRLRGKLYVKGNAQPKSIEHTFAGLVVADQELSSKTVAEIKKQLNTTTGKDAEITVAPGKTAPFMVVFSELPPDLDQYDIELISSIKAQ